MPCVAKVHVGEEHTNTNHVATHAMLCHGLKYVFKYKANDYIFHKEEGNEG